MPGDGGSRTVTRERWRSRSASGNLNPHFHDGSTGVVFDPLTFLSRLTVLVPPPRSHLVVYSGVLAPNSSLRSRIVPGKESEKRKPIGRGEDEDVEKEDPEQQRSLCSRRRSSWAELLKRVFLIDVLSCPFCGERRSVIALITKPEAIVAILECLGRSSRPPPVAPAAGSDMYPVPFRIRICHGYRIRLRPPVPLPVVYSTISTMALVTLTMRVFAAPLS